MSRLGLRKGFVELAAHDEMWHRLFDQEKALLQARIGRFVEAIEHVGSTSVCGLAAKPILDLAVGFADPRAAAKCIAPLARIGYLYRGENGIAGRFYFVKGEPRTHHLHMLPSASEDFRNLLAFRDYLRQNRKASREYDRLKKSLAQKYQANREAYLEGKAEFIGRVLELARQAGNE